MMSFFSPLYQAYNYNVQSILYLFITYNISYIISISILGIFYELTIFTITIPYSIAKLFRITLGQIH